MAYQKCPICNGSGKIINNESTAMYKICNTCKGTGIIDELFRTLPPSANIDTENISQQVNSGNLFKYDTISLETIINMFK